MTYTSGTLGGGNLFDGLVLPRGKSRRVIFGAVVIGFGTVAAAWVIATVAAACMMIASLTGSPNIRGDGPVAPPFAPKTIVLANPYGALASAADFSSSAPISADPGPPPDLTADAAPPPAAAILIIAPLPPKRAPGLGDSAALPPADSVFPSHIQPKRGIVRSSPHENGLPIAAPDSAANPALNGDRNLFQKLFNALNQPSSPALADTRPEDGGIGSAPAYNNSTSLPRAGSRIALYDIEAHTVYMPNGERLEAHSGLGDRLDDSRYVNEKDRGATPPHAYDLVLREQLFHGVAALRLNPVDGGNIFGRTGLLAHRYMLGPRGDSNGCVSFKDYPRFLQAFMSGEVARLVVVTHLAATPSRVASSLRRRGLRYASNNP
jgi:hypothetical protein